jgi:UDP-N-acetylglucosamine 2-epimerase (non-hydrolysing)
VKVINVCGARPNFMKIAPLMRAYRDVETIEPILVHTGQHYDERMSRLFFEDLQIPRPDVNLEVGSGSHAQQTAEIMRRFEPLVIERNPDMVLVVGDVNSTIACALVAAKLGVAVAHVEAGLRSFDTSMPEEINRVLTDRISDLLFVSEPSGLVNLRREGIDEGKVHFVGNVMIDTLLSNRDKANASKILDGLGLAASQYVVVTLHRPSNVDEPATFGRILDVLERVQADLPVVFPMHPRTRDNVQQMGYGPRFEAMPQLRVLDPLGYLDFLKLLTDAAVVLTDSGGIQEETTILRTPCLTLRENTERPVTVEQGTNRVVGTDPVRILTAYDDLRANPPADRPPPEKWDGQAANRIAKILAEWSQ